MNYLAHAFPSLQQSESVDPYFVAGTAVPDLLNVVDRKVRARSRYATSFRQESQQKGHAEGIALAEGIIRHHQDDQWFHQTLAFNQLSLEFTIKIRDLLSPDPGFRPSFLGHILVELLLDDELIRRWPKIAQRYYELLQRIDYSALEKMVALLTGKPVPQMAWFLQKFNEIKFLYDYADDAKLLGRLNQVMGRVKLLPLPESMIQFFPFAREQVAAELDELYLNHLN